MKKIEWKENQEITVNLDNESIYTIPYRENKIGQKGLIR